MPETEASMYSGTLIRRVDRIMDSLADLSESQAGAVPPVPGANSLLAIAVHTMANAEENVLGVIGGKDTVRVRESEFSPANKSVSEIAAEWQQIRAEITEFLDTVSNEMLDTTYDHPRRGRISGRKVLLSATVHAAEHAGHAELTRDWLTSQT
jgi:hypothetical protein